MKVKTVSFQGLKSQCNKYFDTDKKIPVLKILKDFTSLVFITYKRCHLQGILLCKIFAKFSFLFFVNVNCNKYKLYHIALSR
jgi:hypothetical protein